MKKIFFICITILMLYGGSYTSVHQYVVPKGLLNEITNHETLEKERYGNAIPFSLSDNAKKMKDGKWCGNNFYHRYKIFIPSNKYCSSTIGVAIHPNSVVYVLMHFIPQNRVSQIAEIDWTKNKFLYEATQEDFTKFFQSNLSFVAVITNIRSLYISTWNWKKYFSSGWLYLQFIGASDIEEMSQFKTTSYNIRLSFAYEGLTEDKVKEFIKNTIWDKKTNDPIDGFKEIKEKVLYCSEYGKIEPIYGIQNGEDNQSSMISSSQSSSNQSFSSQSNSNLNMSQDSRNRCKEGEIKEGNNCVEKYKNNKQNSNKNQSSMISSSQSSSNQSFSSQSSSNLNMSQNSRNRCKEGEIKEGNNCVEKYNKQNSNKNQSSMISSSSSSSAFPTTNLNMSQNSSQSSSNQSFSSQSSSNLNMSQNSRNRCKEGEIKEGNNCVESGKVKNKGQNNNKNENNGSSRNDNNKTQLIEKIKKETIKEIINKRLKIKAYWVFYGKDNSKEPLKWLLIAGDKIAKLNSKIDWIDLNASIFEKQLDEHNLTIILKLKESSKGKE